MTSQEITTSSGETVRYCGRDFTAQHIEWIRRLIASEPRRNRLQLSREVCEELGWRSPNGRLKDMSCRVAMLRMHRDGLIVLPPARKRKSNARAGPRITAASAPQEPISLPAGALGKLSFSPVQTSKDSSLYNELIQRYHYLGYKPLPGAQIRYLVHCGPPAIANTTSSRRLLAVLGFGAAAWKTAPRDQFITWTARQRERNLHLIVNNARFLILPWITSRNLASRILSEAARRLPQDWQTRFNYQPVLLETFVQKDRFKGTCYRAANWIHLGQTQGRGKLDRYNRRALPVKDIFVYPLRTDFRRVLCISQ